MTEKSIVTLGWIFSVTVFLIIVFLWMAFMPTYRIWSREQNGKAELAEAEWSKQIAVEEARARNDSATLEAEARIKQETAKAEAEIIRAKGVAESNRIIADSLQGNESYLRYLWIDKLGDNQNVIYVPTEAGLPLLEARNK
jgi:regulator of protease activity HflC (stomatin/prohibitin superfamily)